MRRIGRLAATRRRPAIQFAVLLYADSALDAGRDAPEWAVVALRQALALAPAGGTDRADLTRRLLELES